MINTVLNHIEEFIDLQSAIVSAFKRKFTHLSDWRFLIDFPKDGSIEVNGIEWTFHKHGSGLLFQRASDGLTIDVHRNLDRPEYIDAWRLEQYFLSLGEVKSEKELKGDLERLAATELLELVPAEPGTYRLRADRQ